MSQLSDLLEKVKDPTLTLEKIELFRDEMIHLHSAMQISLADLEKSEALYFLNYPDAENTADIKIKRAWKGSPEGQRLIELNRFVKAVAKEVDSLKSRVYRLI